ncbi:HAD family hydrolase [Streptococcus cameli]
MTSGYDCLDVMMEHINKGHALEKLCEQLDIKMEEVYAFGDNLNDEDMLKMAGHAIVPENARPEIKLLAEHIIGPHETGSIITYMEEIVCQSNSLH